MDLAPNDLDGGVINPVVAPELRVVCGEEILIKVQPRVPPTSKKVSGVKSL
jgi:hypothetical protein